MSAPPLSPLIAFGYRRDLLDSRLGVAIDHCRWIAAAAVTAAHLRNGLLPDATPGLPLPIKPFYFVTLFGTQSVVVFFVLSGLLVAGSTLARIRENRFVAVNYAVDRATRLLIVLVPAPLDPARPGSYLVYAGCAAIIVAVAWVFGRLFESRTADVRRWLMGRGRGIAITRPHA